MKTAYATIKGFEVMRMFKKGQFWRVLKAFARKRRAALAFRRWVSRKSTVRPCLSTARNQLEEMTAERGVVVDHDHLAVDSADALQDDEGMEAAELEGVHSGLSRSDGGLRHPTSTLHARQCNSAKQRAVKASLTD